MLFVVLKVCGRGEVVLPAIGGVQSVNARPSIAGQSSVTNSSIVIECVMRP